jgi:putative sigma-54 modulation protein
MNLKISGHHLEVTPAIREYLESKLARVLRHFENVIDINVILSAQKLLHSIEVTAHVPGKDIHVEAQDNDMYVAIDALVDKLDRQMVKHKEKNVARRTDDAIKHMSIVEE